MQANVLARGTGTVSAEFVVVRKRLAGHLHYLRSAARSQGEGIADRAIFTATHDQVSRQAAIEAVVMPASPVASYHKLVLVPGASAEVQEYRAWTRLVMAEIVWCLEHCVAWCAVVHRAPGAPHVHVVLASTGEAGRPVNESWPVIVERKLPPRHLGACSPASAGEVPSSWWGAQAHLCVIGG